MLGWFLTPSRVLKVVVDAPGEAHIADRWWGSRGSVLCLLEAHGVL